MIGFNNFNPDEIKWQNNFLVDFFQEYDWTKGVHEILLSGSIGSAKSTLMSWIAINECLQFRNNRGLIGRRSLPDLKKTIYQSILEMLENSDLKEKEDYLPNETSGSFYFPKTNSELIASSWADRRFKKFRSLQLGFAIIEELSENDDVQAEAYHEITMRVGRLSHIPRQFIISATNPEGESHWCYKHFIQSNDDLIKTYYSVTEDNKFLPPTYIAKLKKSLTPIMAERMLYGRWVDITKDKIYHSYSREKNFKNEEYTVDYKLPIIVAFDFNISDGKPMSAALMQYTKDTFHIFDEAVVHGARTLDICEEIFSHGVLTPGSTVIIHGDATGKARDTRSQMSDYDIILKYFQNVPGLNVKLEVPLANPPIRSRHNRVNAYCLNADNEVRLFVYKKAKTVDEGFRLTTLKKGGDYIEDDSKAYQHVTTSCGYAIVYQTNRSGTVVEFQSPRRK